MTKPTEVQIEAGAKGLREFNRNGHRVDWRTMTTVEVATLVLTAAYAAAPPVEVWEPVKDTKHIINAALDRASALESTGSEIDGTTAHILRVCVSYIEAAAPTPDAGENTTNTPCELKWCKSGQPATIRVTEVIGDGAWNVGICERCYQALAPFRQSNHLPPTSEVERKLRATYMTPQPKEEG